MKIVANHSGEYNDVINSYYNLERHDDGSEEEVLFQGYSTSKNPVFKNRYKDYRKRAYLNLEAPCSFTTTLTHVREAEYFTHIYSICPYTCEWLNKITDTKHVPIAFPYREGYAPNTDVEKEYDAIYMGGVMNMYHAKMIEVLKNYNYVHTSLVRRPNLGIKPTHVKIRSEKKMDLLAKSKVCVAMNLAPITIDHVQMISSNYGWKDNEAFSRLGTRYIPQFKPRIIEAAISKTLILVKRDQWNVIEQWFEPYKHFLYWEDLDELNKLIREVINNYDNYTTIVDSAYEKVKEYEIDNIYENIILKF